MFYILVQIFKAFLKIWESQIKSEMTSIVQITRFWRLRIADIKCSCFLVFRQLIAFDFYQLIWTSCFEFWSQYVCYTFLLTEFSSFVIQSHQTIQYESWEWHFLQRDWNCFLLNYTTNSATTCHSEMLKRRIRNAILKLYI